MIYLWHILLDIIMYSIYFSFIIFWFLLCYIFISCIFVFQLWYLAVTHLHRFGAEGPRGSWMGSSFIHLWAGQPAGLPAWTKCWNPDRLMVGRVWAEWGGGGGRGEEGGAPGIRPDPGPAAYGPGTDYNPEPDVRSQHRGGSSLWEKTHTPDHHLAFSPRTGEFGHFA